MGPACQAHPLSKKPPPPLSDLPLLSLSLCSYCSASAKLGFRSPARRRLVRCGATAATATRCTLAQVVMKVASGNSGGGSSAYQPLASHPGPRTGLPLVPCPECGAEILELQCGPGSKVPGAIFFKCRFHDRDVPESCPWILFQKKYEQFLVARGLIGREGRHEQPVVVNTDEVGGLQGEDDGVDALKTRIAGLDAKLKKLVDLGLIGVVCCVIVTVFVVVGVISIMLK